MTIQECLNNIKEAMLGKDVRKSIHDGIEQCYKDATGNPESVAYVKDLVENTPYTEYSEDNDMQLPIHTINDEKISEESTWSSKELIDRIYPVGSIYMTTSSENPKVLLGGTWVAWGAGKVPVGINASDGDFNAAEKTGGNKTHLHSTANHTLTINETPSHSHIEMAMSTGDVTQTGSLSHVLGDITRPDVPHVLNTYTSTANTGGGQAHNHGDTGSASNLQPYITCYMWKRTA